MFSTALLSNAVLAAGPTGGAFELGWLSWIIVGLIAGALAKLILPGNQGGGFLATMIIGIIGAIVGGLIAGLLFGGDMGWGLGNIWMWVFAILGSIIVLLIWGFIQRGRGGTTVR